VCVCGQLQALSTLPKEKQYPSDCRLGEPQIHSEPGNKERNPSPFLGLKMETVCFPKTLVSTFKSTGHHYPEDQN
jgi:hypothetical protein